MYRGRRRTGRTGGYILEQLLITLLITAFLMPIVTSLLSITIHALERPVSLQDEMGITQLRRVIAVSEAFEVKEAEVDLTHHGTQMRLRLVNERLVLSDPGTQIFLTDLESMSFQTKGGLLYILYAHPGTPEITQCLGPLE
ncbi:MAG: hypothetical protein IJ225_04840 [Solobacterium sp.]|nr:hypothetical protein [Solobacterium sp.]